MMPVKKSIWNDNSFHPNHFLKTQNIASAEFLQFVGNKLYCKKATEYCLLQLYK